MLHLTHVSCVIYDFHYSMRYRPFPQEEDLASIDEEALKAKEEAEKEKKDDDEEEEYVGEIQLSKIHAI